MPENPKHNDGIEKEYSGPNPSGWLYSFAAITSLYICIQVPNMIKYFHRRCYYGISQRKVIMFLGWRISFFACAKIPRRSALCLGQGNGTLARLPDLELTFENDTITIRKRSAQIPEDFMRSARIDRHQVKIYLYYHADTLCSTIYADFTSRVVSIENHTDVLIHRAFGCNLSPTWQDFLIFWKNAAFRAPAPVWTPS